MNPETKALFDATSPFGSWSPRGLAATSLTLLRTLPSQSPFRRLAFLLRKPIKSGKQQFYDCRVWDLRLRLCARGNLTEQRWLTMEQFHDRREREVLRQSLPERAVFLDVGANAGFYTFWVLAKCRGSRAIAVEPATAMVDRLRFNLRLNQLEDRVRIFQCAATPEPCEVCIVEGADNLGQTAIQTQGSGQRVPGRPLMDMLREAGVERVDAMKIDIEGHEVAVLEAFFKNAPRSLWPKLIIGEIVGDSGGALKNLLGKNAYSLQQVTKMNGIFRLNSG